MARAFVAGTVGFLAGAAVSVFVFGRGAVPPARSAAGDSPLAAGVAAPPEEPARSREPVALAPASAAVRPSPAPRPAAALVPALATRPSGPETAAGPAAGEPAAPPERRNPFGGRPREYDPLRGELDLSGPRGEREKPEGRLSLHPAELEAIAEIFKREQSEAETELEGLRRQRRLLELRATAVEAAAREEADAAVRARLGDDVYRRYVAERESGRLAEAVGALALRDQGFLGLVLGAEEGLAGLRVMGALPGGGAAAVGIAEGDVVERVNGHAVLAIEAFVAEVRRVAPGQPIVIAVRPASGGPAHDYSVILGDAGRELLDRLYREDPPPG